MDHFEKKRNFVIVLCEMSCQYANANDVKRVTHIPGFEKFRGVAIFSDPFALLSSGAPGQGRHRAEGTTKRNIGLFVDPLCSCVPLVHVYFPPRRRRPELCCSTDTTIVPTSLVYRTTTACRLAERENAETTIYVFVSQLPGTGNTQADKMFRLQKVIPCEISLSERVLQITVFNN